MRHILSASCLLALGLAVANCGGTPAPPPAQHATPGKRVDPTTVGTIAGRVTFEGARPVLESIRMNADASCVQAAGPTAPNESAVIAADGGLQNVFVYIKDDFNDYTFDPPAGPVKIDQRGCRYLPHVLGARVGQSIEVLNSDPTIHNVHAIPMKNQEFNEGQPIQGMTATAVFTAPEVMVRFKCDVHGWMNAYVGVLAHPFFAVSKADGTFSIEGIPAGTYTVEAWHEKFGTETQKVTVVAGTTMPAAFTFSATPRK
jgi:plastocyanin